MDISEVKEGMYLVYDVLKDHYIYRVLKINIYNDGCIEYEIVASPYISPLRNNYGVIGITQINESRVATVDEINAFEDQISSIIDHHYLEIDKMRSALD